LERRRADAEELLGARLPDDWPDDDDAHHLRRWLNDLAREGVVAPWRARAVVRSEDERMIGHAGFHGPQDENGVLEIGYKVFAPFRGDGYATEAARRLLDFAKELGATTLRASVSPGNAPSLAIVATLGLVKVGERIDDVDGLEFVFERPL
jgi:RimJ/RimL family protein N-acetyltransferase